MTHFFQSIPNLESLEYSHGNLFQEEFEYDCRPSQRYSLRAVPMNHMKSFSITDSCFAPAITVFSYLALPPSADTSFWWNARENEDQMEPDERLEALEHFASALKSGLSPFTDVLIAGSHVRPLYDEIERELEQFPRLDLAAPLLDTRDMRLRVEPCLLGALQPMFLHATYLRLAMSPIYGIRGTDRWSALWMNLHRFSDVQELHLFSKNVVWFVSHLEVRLADFPKDSPPLFPVLRSITLSDFDFTKEWQVRGDGDSRPFLQVLGNVVKDMYGELESFEDLFVGTTCNGYESAVEHLKLSIGDNRVEVDHEV